MTLTDFLDSLEPADLPDFDDIAKKDFCWNSHLDLAEFKNLEPEEVLRA